MKFDVESSGEYKLLDVTLGKSKTGFGVVKLYLEDVNTGMAGFANMAIMDWERIKREVDRLLVESLPERVDDELPPGEYTMQCISNTSQVTEAGLEFTTVGFIIHEGKKYRVSHKQRFKTDDGKS